MRLAPLLGTFALDRPWRRAIGYVVALLGTIGLTLVLLPFRDDITPLSKGFGFLVVVVAAAAIGGIGPGIVASLVAFLTFNYFFLPPYGTFQIGRGEYVVVLFVFLGLSILISLLLARATSRAEAAEMREAELRTLQTLSTDLVSAVPGLETYTSILTRMLEVFGFTAGALWVKDPEGRGLEERVRVGVPPDELTPSMDSTTGAPPERLPLAVGGRVLGLFLLRRERAALTPPENRVMRSFCDQFALVLERDRLLHAATEAAAYRQTEEVRRSLLAAVSHDLRSPLAAIKASVTDLLSRDAEPTAGSGRESLESIDTETDRLISLVANLLDMSRIEGGVLKARIQAVDLADVISSAVDRLQRQWADLGFRIRLYDDPAIVLADPVFLDRVLANLLENAAKTSISSGSRDVEVEERRSDSEITVRVIDHGDGVPESAREQLFYPFYQVQERHPRLGTGLGLAIAKGFLTLMAGEIWIEETPGGGATFAFSLPVSAAATAEP